VAEHKWKKKYLKLFKRNSLVPLDLKSSRSVQVATDWTNLA